MWNNGYSGQVWLPRYPNASLSVSSHQQPSALIQTYTYKTRLSPSSATKQSNFLALSPICIPSNNQQHHHQLEVKLRTLLERVEGFAVSGMQKLLLYRAGICPRLNWDLAIMNLPTTWVPSSFKATATSFLKRCSGLAKPANTARLYLPKVDGGLALPSISLLYKRLKVSQPHPSSLQGIGSLRK